MTDEAALRAAIHDRPRDTTPRLILADYHEDNDQPHEAALHRAIADPNHTTHPTSLPRPGSVAAYGDHTKHPGMAAYYLSDVAASHTFHATPPGAPERQRLRQAADTVLDHAATAGHYPSEDGPWQQAVDHLRAAAGHRKLAADHATVSKRRKAGAHTHLDAFESHLKAAVYHEAAAHQLKQSVIDQHGKG